jgi:hypothetical protein
MIDQGRLTVERGRELRDAVQKRTDDETIEVIPRDIYAAEEASARRRVPRDARDWPTVALALALDAAFRTADGDFLGCRCPTWTVTTLRAELGDA